MSRPLRHAAAALAVLVVLAAAAAEAQGRGCTRNGVPVPEGTVMGPFKCVDGKWVRTR